MSSPHVAINLTGTNDLFKAWTDFTSEWNSLNKQIKRKPQSPTIKDRLEKVISLAQSIEKQNEERLNNLRCGGLSKRAWDVITDVLSVGSVVSTVATCAGAIATTYYQNANSAVPKEILIFTTFAASVALAVTTPVAINDCIAKRRKNFYADIEERLHSVAMVRLFLETYQQFIKEDDKFDDCIVLLKDVNPKDLDKKTHDYWASRMIHELPPTHKLRKRVDKLNTIITNLKKQDNSDSSTRVSGSESSSEKKTRKYKKAFLSDKQADTSSPLRESSKTSEDPLRKFSAIEGIVGIDLDELTIWDDTGRSSTIKKAELVGAREQV